MTQVGRSVGKRTKRGKCINVNILSWANKIFNSYFTSSLLLTSNQPRLTRTSWQCQIGCPFPLNQRTWAENWKFTLSVPTFSSAYVLSRFSHVQLFVTLWTVACQVPLSLGFSRQEYWSGLPCPPPGNLPNPGIKPKSLTSPALPCIIALLMHYCIITQAAFIPLRATWEAPSAVSTANSFQTVWKFSPKVFQEQLSHKMFPGILPSSPCFTLKSHVQFSEDMRVGDGLLLCWDTSGFQFSSVTSDAAMNIFAPILWCPHVQIPQNENTGPSGSVCPVLLDSAP